MSQSISYIRFNDVPTAQSIPNPINPAGPPPPYPGNQQPSDEKSISNRAYKFVAELIISIAIFVINVITYVIEPFSIIFGFGGEIIVPVFTIISASIGLVAFKNGRYKNFRIILTRFILCICGSILFSGLFCFTVIRMFMFGTFILGCIVLVFIIVNVIICIGSAKLIFRVLTNISSNAGAIVPAPPKYEDTVPTSRPAASEEPVFTVPVNSGSSVQTNSTEPTTEGTSIIGEESGNNEEEPILPAEMFRQRHQLKFGNKIKAES